jgi:hypothetical protein
MFCTSCGNKLESDDKFCGQCGKAVRVQPVRKPDIEPERIPEKIPKEPILKEPYIPPIVSKHIPSGTKWQKAEEKRKAELKVLLEKSAGREVTDSELNESEFWLKQYADLIYRIYQTDQRRQEKLKENPKGFHLEGQGYSCAICGRGVSDQETWYDQHGVKCLICQKAIDDKVIPETAASDKDSWYSVSDFEHSFFINRYGVRRFVKEGLLKPRIIPAPNGRPHCQIFLIEDQKDVLPPKKLTEWPLVKFKQDGEDRYHSEPWLYHANPMEVLKDYKILDYMKNLKETEIQKDIHDLSFQLPEGAKHIMHVNCIDKTKPDSPAEKKTE